MPRLQLLGLQGLAVQGLGYEGTKGTVVPLI